MKKLFITSIALLAGSVCFAQFEKGNLKVGGELELSVKTSDSDNNIADDDYRNIGFDFAPHAGFFLCESFCVGGGISVGYDVETYNIEEYGIFGRKQIELSDKAVNFGIAPGVEYYYGFGEKKKVGLTARGSIGYTLRSGSYEQYDNLNDRVDVLDYLSNSIGIMVVPGVYYRPTPCLMLAMKLGGFRVAYRYSVTDYSTENYIDKSHKFNFGGNFDKLWYLDQTAIGVSYIFGAKNGNTAAPALE